MKYFSERNGTVFAILNAGVRERGQQGAVLSVPLQGRKLDAYRTMKKGGKRDSVIFRTLFPTDIPKPPATAPKVEIELTELSKTQITHVIERQLGTKLKSLTKMCLNDLRLMLLALRKPR